jgi:hypothetical protein
MCEKTSYHADKNKSQAPAGIPSENEDGGRKGCHQAQAAQGKKTVNTLRGI